VQLLHAGSRLGSTGPEPGRLDSTAAKVGQQRAVNFYGSRAANNDLANIPSKTRGPFPAEAGIIAHHAHRRSEVHRVDAIYVRAPMTGGITIDAGGTVRGGGGGGGYAIAGTTSSNGGAAGYAVRKNGNAATITNNGTMTGTAA
jgi:hypothetical protein